MRAVRRRRRRSRPRPGRRAVVGRLGTNGCSVSGAPGEGGRGGQFGAQASRARRPAEGHPAGLRHERVAVEGRPRGRIGTLPGVTVRRIWRGAGGRVRRTARRAAPASSPRTRPGPENPDRSRPRSDLLDRSVARVPTGRFPRVRVAAATGSVNSRRSPGGVVRRERRGSSGHHGTANGSASRPRPKPPATFAAARGRVRRAPLRTRMEIRLRRLRRSAYHPARHLQAGKARPLVAIDPYQEFLVQPVDASWLQCNIECQEACPVGTNCRGYLNLAAEGRFEEGYILSPRARTRSRRCAPTSARRPCERACRRGDIDRPLAIRAMKRFLVEWHEASGIPDDMPQITPRDERGRGRRRRPGRPRRRPRAGRRGLPGHGLRQPALRRRHDAHRRAGLPPAARGDRDGRPAGRAAGRRRSCSTRAIGIDITFEQLQRDFDAIAITAGAMNPVDLDVPGADLDGVQYGVDFMKKANLGQPLEVGRRRRRHRRRLHRDGLLAHEPPPRRRERDHRLPPHALRARRRRGGAGRDRARGRPHGVPRQPDRGARRGRHGHRRQVHPQQAGRARRLRPPLAGADRGLASSSSRPTPSSRPCRQAADLTFLPVEASFEVNRGRVKVDPATYATNVRGVFACGDFVTGPTTLIEAAGHGKKCAYAIDRYLAGRHGRDGRRQREDHQLVAPRDARALRRPAAPAHPDGPAAGRGCRRPIRRSTSRRRWSCGYDATAGGRRVDPLPDVQLQHLVRPVPVRAVRRLRRRLPRGRHPHGRHQPAEDRRACCPRSRRPTAGAGRGDDPRRGALHPLRPVRQALPVRRHYDGAVRAPGDLERRRLYKESYRTRSSPGRPAWQEEPGELPRAGGPDHPPERRLAVALPQAVPRRRAVARVRGHEQRVPAPAPGAGPPARGQVRLHVLPRRPVVLPVPRADRDGRLPDVLLRPVGRRRRTRTSSTSRAASRSAC